MRQGQVVIVAYDRQRIRGRLLLVSPNDKSLAVLLDEPFRTQGGTYFKMLPLLMNDAGEYQDLCSQTIIAVEPDHTDGAEKDPKRWN